MSLEEEASLPLSLYGPLCREVRWLTYSLCFSKEEEKEIQLSLSGRERRKERQGDDYRKILSLIKKKSLELLGVVGVMLG